MERTSRSFPRLGLGFAYLLVDSPSIFVDSPSLFVDLPTLFVRKEREREKVIGDSLNLNKNVGDEMEENPINVEDEYLFTS